MRSYLELLDHLLIHGEEKSDRTGTGTLSVFGQQLKFSLSPNFPLLTTKKIHLRSIIYELLWFLKGDTNIKYLNDNNVTIWDEWANEDGDLGRVYGAQWTNWTNSNGDKFNQIERLIDSIKNKPNDRRHIVCAWNPGELNQMALPPCHALFQFYVSSSKLSCQLYQRSADLFLGVPFNIASYSLLTMMIAQVCDLQAHEFIHTFGDLHLYKNHIDQAKEQLSREPRDLPLMNINPSVKDINMFCYEDFNLENYNPHPAIRAPISI